jgi:hypothetical protein
MGWLVGAVGIEINAERSFKDLGEMRGNAKSMRRNNRECEGILIGPLMAPRFFGAEIPSRVSSRYTKANVGIGPNLAARMANRLLAF